MSVSNSQMDVAISTLKLDERVDIGRAESTYIQFEEALARNENINVDASAVERIDTSGFQLLVAFCRAVEKKGLKARIIDPSEIFQSNARLLGLEPHLPVASY